MKNFHIITAGLWHLTPVEFADLMRVTDTYIDVSDVLYDPLTTELREQTGLNAEVHDFVMRSHEARTISRSTADLMLAKLRAVRPKGARGERPLVTTIVCRGGRHRSVALGAEVASNIAYVLGHRDAERSGQVHHLHVEADIIGSLDYVRPTLDDTIVSKLLVQYGRVFS